MFIDFLFLWQLNIRLSNWQSIARVALALASIPARQIFAWHIAYHITIYYSDTGCSTGCSTGCFTCHAVSLKDSLHHVRYLTASSGSFLLFDNFLDRYVADKCTPDGILHCTTIIHFAQNILLVVVLVVV